MKRKKKILLSDIVVGKEEIEAVSQVLRSRWLTQGEVTRGFEEEFARFLGVGYARAVANGTAALHLALRALGIGAGDEVIVPTLTFVATANAVVYAGARPVFAEVTSRQDLTVCPEDVARKITTRTRAIMVMHYGGYACDMERLCELARGHQLRVIEDAAHAPGGELAGKKLGSWGDIACFSFYGNKNMVTGEGGMVVTNDEQLAHKVELLRSHALGITSLERAYGSPPHYEVVELGYNYRLDELRSAIGLVQLNRLEESNRRREQVTARYRKLLEECEAVELPFGNYRGKPAFHLMSALVDTAKRTRVITQLGEAGIQTSVHYPAVHLFRYYRELFNHREGELQLAEEVARCQLTLPLHPLMKEEEVDYVVAELKRSLECGG